MRIDPSYQIEQATPRKDTRRPVLNTVCLERPDPLSDKGIAVACDGFILAVVPVTLEETDVPGMVPVHLFPLARKAWHKRMGSEMTLVLGETTVTLPSGSVHSRVVDGQYPDWKRVVPDSLEGSVAEIGFDHRLIARLGKALDDPVSLRFRFQGALSPIRVETSNGAYGVLMPMHIAK